MHEQILAFLSFRPALLHRIDPQQPAWPSPRSWAMASLLHAAALDVSPVVGAAAAAEFRAFLDLYAALASPDAILRGDGATVDFPEEPSARYAITTGLTIRAADAAEAHRAFCWLADRASPEWVQLFAADLFARMRERGQMGALARLVAQDERLRAFVSDYQKAMADG